MNQKEIWCVVKPSVGLPLFLGAVATTSLLVHYSILTHTTWYPAFLNGKAARMSDAGPVNGAPALANVTIRDQTSTLAAK